MSDLASLVAEELAQTPITFDLLPSDRKKTFSDFATLGRFLADEQAFWAPMNGVSVIQALTQPLTGAIQNFESAKVSAPSNPNGALGQFHEAIRLLKTAKLFAETDEGAFLRDLSSLGPNYVHGACCFLFPGYSQMVASNEQLNGYLRAFIRFTKAPRGGLGDATATVEKQKKALDAMFADLQERFNADTKAMSDQRETLVADYSSLKQDLEREQVDWKKKFDDLYSEKKEKHESLAVLYEEQLFLQEPVKHWNKLGETQRTRGLAWAGVSLLLAVMGSVGAFCSFPVLTTALTAVEVASRTGTNDSIQWSTVVPITVLFGVVVSVWVFLIRTTVKLSLSGFHLLSDATERAYLSNFYLSILEKDKTLDAETRKIIYQSLFSRAETGILKGESGPTMPGIQEILKNGRGG